MHVKLSEVFAALVNLERLVLLVGVNASWAENPTVIGNEFQNENYLKKVTHMLPYFRDVTLGKIFWDYYAILREIALAGIKYNSELPPSPEIISENMVRLCIAEGILGDTGLHHLPKFFPNVRHLVLLHPQEKPDHSIKPMHTQLPALLDSFCFLESLELGDIWNIRGDSIPLIPPKCKSIKASWSSRHRVGKYKEYKCSKSYSA